MRIFSGATLALYVQLVNTSGKAINIRGEQLALASTGVTGVVDNETAKWLAGLDRTIYEKLAALAGQTGLSDNTVHRRCGIAKQFFKVATKRNLVASNPFEELTSTVRGNTKRFYFVTRKEAAPGTVYAITKYRDSNCNLRTQLLRIIRKAGLKPWPKLFQNLRSTR